MTRRMTKNLNAMLDALPASRRAKVMTRATELASLRDFRVEAQKIQGEMLQPSRKALD